MRFFLVIICSLTTVVTSAQLIQLPIDHTNNVNRNTKTLSRARLQAEDTVITLPFWDDFSQSNGQLDPKWWLVGDDVQVVSNPGIGIAPPTINVATFDGVNGFGLPYSTTNTYGPTDSLVSNKIDMTQIPKNLRSTVFLSFYYQRGGLGEIPDNEDSLLLYFKYSDSTWRKVWPLPNDIIPSGTDKFEQTFIEVSDTGYFHNNFQFKFQAIGKQNGTFDNWHLDYVYMDKRRNANDISYLDRSFTTYPTTIFNQYYALPYEEFIKYTSQPGLLTGSSTTINNLESDVQPVVYNCILYDTLNKSIVQELVTNEELLLFIKESKVVESPAPNPSSFNPNTDSLYLEIRYTAQTGDKFLIDSIYNNNLDTAFYNHIDLRVNDTVSTYFTLKDYYAYDDGSAEYGAGINQKDGRIAYQYITNIKKYINKVDVYFPNTSRTQAGTPIELFVYKDLKGGEFSELATTTESVQQSGINNFATYTFSTPAQVQDTFYIGVRHLGIDGEWLSIGLDKSNDTSDRFYANVDGSWVTSTNLTGSLMLRPYVTDDYILGVEDAFSTSNIDVYPNPNTGEFYINGNFDNIEIFDIYGRHLPFSIVKEIDRNKIYIKHQDNTIAIIKTMKNGIVKTKKILIKH